MKTTPQNLRRYTAAAMFAALTCAVTLLIHIPIPLANGYVHLGDAVIMIAASLLPPPFAAASAALGASLADILSGSAVWAPATLIIKAAVAACFTSKTDKTVCRRNLAACAAATVITIAGYFAAEWLIYRNTAACVASVPWNIAQSIASCAAYLLIAPAIDKTDARTRLR